jgi:hypothetical protein
VTIATRKQYESGQQDQRQEDTFLKSSFFTRAIYIYIYIYHLTFKNTEICRNYMIFSLQYRYDNLKVQ